MTYTYREVGATRDARLPAGYRHVQRDVVIGEGEAVFERAAAALMSWRMHRAAGLAVVPGSAPEAVPGALVVLWLGWGPLGVRIPCRVVYCLDHPRLRGFAYGTLPGHPERGEEAFAVQLTGSGQVRFRIAAFSRPATLLAKAGGPVTVLVQELATSRYVAALRRVSQG